MLCIQTLVTLSCIIFTLQWIQLACGSPDCIKEDRKCECGRVPSSLSCRGSSCVQMCNDGNCTSLKCEASGNCTSLCQKGGCKNMYCNSNKCFLSLGPGSSGYCTGETCSGMIADTTVGFTCNAKQSCVFSCMQGCDITANSQMNIITCHSGKCSVTCKNNTQCMCMKSDGTSCDVIKWQSYNPVCNCNTNCSVSPCSITCNNDTCSDQCRQTQSSTMASDLNCNSGTCALFSAGMSSIACTASTCMGITYAKDANITCEAPRKCHITCKNGCTVDTGRAKNLSLTCEKGTCNLKCRNGTTCTCTGQGCPGGSPSSSAKAMPTFFAVFMFTILYLLMQ